MGRPIASKLMIRWISATFLAVSLLAGGAAEKSPAFSAFFPFCIDWHDSRKRGFEEQATMLKDLGYPGVGHIWLDKLPERIESLDKAGLKLYQVTIKVSIAPGEQPYDPRLKEYMPLVKGRGVQFLLLMNGMKPSDPAGDTRAVEIVRELAELAKPAGAEMLLYPHTDFWLEQIEDCVRIAQKVGQPNVGVMFNLCHWLRVSKDRDYETRLKAAMPYLRAVSINGADERDEKRGWERYIQPLGRGDFDTCEFLKRLSALGYNGTVGLQCYGIGGDTRDHLQESLKAWKACVQRQDSKPAP
jgi:sugar phosphate isomerase/epimerase